MRRVATLALATSFLLAAPAAGAAADTVRYVAPGGSISAALRSLPRGGTVRVAPGRYPALADATVRSHAVTVEGWHGRPTLAGLQLLGASRLRLAKLSIAGPVMITDDVFHTRGSSRIALSDSEVTAPGATCITVRSAARRIMLRRLRVHDCATGLGGPGGAPISRHVTLADSRLRGFTGDAVQFGRWDDVSILRNRITDIHDPAGVIHNDAVQFTGFSRHVRIVGNELARSGGQLLFIQDALGPIDDVLVRDNLIHDSAAYAIQSMGATRVRFIDNTVWHSRWGGLLIREGHRPTRDTVVEGNILSGLEVDPNTRIRRNRWNVIRCGFPGAGRPCATDASFTAGYRLRRGTPLARLAVGPARLRAVRIASRPRGRTSGQVPVRDRTD